MLTSAHFEKINCVLRVTAGVAVFIVLCEKSGSHYFAPTKPRKHHRFRVGFACAPLRLTDSVCVLVEIWQTTGRLLAEL